MWFKGITMTGGTVNGTTGLNPQNAVELVPHHAGLGSHRHGVGADRNAMTNFLITVANGTAATDLALSSTVSGGAATGITKSGPGHSTRRATGTICRQPDRQRRNVQHGGHQPVHRRPRHGQAEHVLNHHRQRHLDEHRRRGQPHRQRHAPQRHHLDLDHGQRRLGHLLPRPAQRRQPAHGHGGRDVRFDDQRHRQPADGSDHDIQRAAT